MIRVFAVSDLHVDYKQNLNWVNNLSDVDYKNDTLVIAGDISDNLTLLSHTLRILTHKFKHVGFVPGNHDLWIRKKEAKDSLQKFYMIIDLCAVLGVKTSGFTIGDRNPLQIQPLFSWYEKPEEGNESLFLAKKGEDPSLSMWVDNYTVKWPVWEEYQNAADFFIRMNAWRTSEENDVPILSFSHFLPRQDLIFGSKTPEQLMKEGYIDPAPKFNFSRVAGTYRLEKQIRNLSVIAHIYGHQHRNRDREIENIRYISHGLGYPRERIRAGLSDDTYAPKLIWDSEKGFTESQSY